MPNVAFRCLTLVMALLAGPAPAGFDARQVMAEVRQRWEAVDESAQAVLEIVDETGRGSERRFTFWLSCRPTGDLNRFRFTAPEYMRGLQLLGRGHEQYLKPPDLKARKIAFREKGLSFVQSEFYYEDLEGWKLDSYAYKPVTRTEDRLVFDCVPMKNSVYSRLQVTVDPRRWVILRTDYYDRQRRLWKTQTNSAWVEAAPDVWRWREAEMVNHLSRRKSRVIFAAPSFTRLPASTFALTSLES